MAGIIAGIGGLLDLLGVGAAAAAPEVAAAAPEALAFAPEAAAAAVPDVIGAALPSVEAITAAGGALPEIVVPAAAPELAAGAGAEAALGGGAAAGISDVLGGLGAGAALGITPAIAGGLSPSSIVSGEFNALNAGAPGAPPGNFGTSVSTPISLNQVPGFSPGGAPLPTPAPGLGGGASPLSPGTGAGGPASTTPPDSTTIQPGGTGPATGLADFGATQSATPSDITQGLSLTNPASTNVGTGGIGNFLSKNAGLLGLLGLGVGGQLASPALSRALGLNKVPNSEDLKALAQTEAGIASQQEALGQQLQQPLITGQLPSGAEAALSNALNDAISTIKGRYASLGLSNSTMESDAIAHAQQEANAQRFTIAQQMAQTGQADISSATGALGLESQIYDTLLQATIQQDEQLGNAISQFAAAAGLGTAIGAAKGG